MDDDTFVWVERFKEIKLDYAGIQIIANDGGSPKLGIPSARRGTYPLDYACGGAYWLSKRSMKIIAESPFNDDWAEDRWVGHTLAQHEIKLEILPDYDQAFHHPLEFYMDKSLAVLTQIPENRIQEIAVSKPPQPIPSKPKQLIRRQQIIVQRHKIVDRRRPR